MQTNVAAMLICFWANILQIYQLVDDWAPDPHLSFGSREIPSYPFLYKIILSRLRSKIVADKMFFCMKWLRV